MTTRPLSKRPEDYFLTFHTYGTWLPGDARGWHRHGDGAAHRPPAPALERWCRNQMKANPLYFSVPQRQIVRDAVLETCDHRGYPVHALTVQRTHVHVVLTATAAPDRVVADLKRWATRALRENGLPPDQPVWADHGSTRYVYYPDGREGSSRYVFDDHHRSRTR